MTDQTKTLGQAAYERHQAESTRSNDWSRMEQEHHDVWEAIAQAAIDASDDVDRLRRIEVNSERNFQAQTLQIESLKKQRDELTAERDRLSGQYKAACWDRECLQKRRDELESERDRLRGQVDELQRKLARADIEIAHYGLGRGGY